MNTHTQVLPVIDEKSGNYYNRLLVAPSTKEEHLSENGLLIPEDAGKVCEEGVVFAVCEGSVLNPGDIVMYNKINRQERENDIAVVDGVEYDVLYEHEIWSINEMPHNRLFVDPMSDLQISDGGILIPEDAKGIPQKGIIRCAPINSDFKQGDVVEYRKKEQNIYSTVNIDGKVMDVLFDTDIFTINGKVSPYRIIVKIDVGLQSIKRNTTASGIKISQLFSFMLYNLQYGEVVEIGDEAAKHYPELKKGDTAILHHFIESQPYRLLKTEKGKHVNVAYEYRVINTFDPRSREIFGKIKFYNRSKSTGKADFHLVPFGENIFLDWEFSLMQKMSANSEDVFDLDYSLDKCHDLEDLKITADKKRDAGVSAYKMKYTNLAKQLEGLNPNIPEQLDVRLALEGGIEQLRRDAEKISGYINNNHLLECTDIVNTRMVLVPYKELYPINILGKKFLISHTNLIMAEMKQQNLRPLQDRVLVTPINEDSKSDIIIPDSAKPAPHKGLVIAVGDDKKDVKKGDTILYSRGSGTPIPGNENQILLRSNDCLAVL